jgi:nucleoside-diphosphate-sugar epimerase
MRVFVTGGTGAIGAQLLPLLIADGHEVVALARSDARASEVAELGVRAVVANVFDRNALTRTVETARPEIIIHELTAIPVALDFRKLDEAFALTNRMRTEVTDTLLAAGRQAGARRFIAQSFCGWPYARVGGPVKTEDDPLDPRPPAAFSRTLAAIRYLEEAVRRADGLEALALRYGFFYGPGTSISADGSVVELVRRRRLPLVGNSAGIWSFIHINDAARATMAALTRGAPGIYNVVDDEPAPVSDWLPALAQAVGAKPPFRVPAWLARPMIGDGGLAMMTQIRGGSNAKARHELAWQPNYPSWRRGFVEGLS